MPVSIEALRKHFTEGETRLARALNELEAEGFLERVPVRAANGEVRTLTYVYDDPSPAAPRPAERGQRAPSPGAGTPRAPKPQPATPRPAPSPGPATPPPTAEAIAVLTALRLEDPRLLLSERDVTRLAPAVDDWLRRGIGPRNDRGDPQHRPPRPDPPKARRADRLPPAPPQTDRSGTAPRPKCPAPARPPHAELRRLRPRPQSRTPGPVPRLRPRRRRPPDGQAGRRPRLAAAREQLRRSGLEGPMALAMAS